MTGPKLNERPGTRATLRGYQMSASKARVVLNLIRGQDVNTARDILTGTTREAADVSLKVLNSAIANAVNNDGLSADELYVSAAYADEGITLKRFSPRARGRAGRINKRACHITIIVSRMDDDRLAILQAARSAQSAASRARRVASSRRASTPAAAVEAPVVESVEPETNVDVAVVTEVVTPEVETETVETVETADVASDVVENEAEAAATEEETN
jgi:large subunit ribosomal protein L22